ncbi:uncharacterized protein DS421_16g539030 [Arachis hypogaea]|nr:uncharacterized protein DS421_16g539030 [Arachis hypogaea]
MVPAATVTAAFIHRFPAVLSNKQGKEKILLFSYSPAMPMRHSHSPQSTVPFGPSPFCTNLHFLFSVKAAKPDKMHPTVISHCCVGFKLQLLYVLGQFAGTLFDFARCHITAQNMEMEAITASLERSLQNCSLNNHSHESRREEGSVTDAEADAEAGIGISSSSDDVLNNRISNSDTTLELNSHISLPYHWEQCLDLKTGEIYYINWQNGMKAKEDPRRVAEYSSSMSRDYKSEEESWYDSEESSSESCPSSSKDQCYQELGQVEKQNNSSSSSSSSSSSYSNNKGNVLVVAGCKSCLMYFMVPKQVEDCPKCGGQLLHFDRSESGSP